MTHYARRLAELLASGGGSAATLSAQLRAEGFTGASRSAVGRELQKLRGSQRVGRRPVAPAPPEAEPPAPPAGDIPTEAEIEAAPLATREQWLELAGRSARAAEARGDVAALAKFGTLANSLLESIRKAKPKEAPPEGTFVTSADMAALAKQGRERLQALVRDLFPDERLAGELAAERGERS